MTLNLEENLLGAGAEPAREREARGGLPVVCSHSRTIAAPEDLLPLLLASKRAGEPSFYWEQPARDHAIAAVGSVWHAASAGAQRFDELAAACARLRDRVTVTGGDDGPLLLGAFAFSPDDTMDGVWRGFANARVDLPRLCIVRRGGRATLTVNSVYGAPADPSVPTHTNGSASFGVAAAASPARYHTYATPPPQAWKASVAAAVADIRRGAFAKLVLARGCHIECERPFDAPRSLCELRRRYPTCTIFSVSNGEADFLGATPETLLSLRGDEVRTAALAGTTGRASSPTADRRLALDLTRSDKNGAEHAIVIRAIRAELAALCDEVAVERQPRLLALENVQHLHTPIRGRLRRPRHLLEVAARLHPSPAVGGFPRDVALRELSAREDVARGLYSGALGWMDLRGDGELAVALRCAVLRGGHAALFAGAGIVADSEPEAELCETRMKLQPLLSALMEL
jgi:isochorismate synthase